MQPVQRPLLSIVSQGCRRRALGLTAEVKFGSVSSGFGNRPDQEEIDSCAPLHHRTSSQMTLTSHHPIHIFFYPPLHVHATQERHQPLSKVASDSGLVQAPKPNKAPTKASSRLSRGLLACFQSSLLYIRLPSPALLRLSRKLSKATPAHFRARRTLLTHPPHSLSQPHKNVPVDHPLHWQRCRR